MQLSNEVRHTTTTASRTIFLAEDDIDDQEFLEEAFLSIDPAIKLKSFISGKKFIEHLEQTGDNQLPCLIILDYNIPEINGAEILRHLGQFKRYNHISKVIWSTSDSDLYRNSCLQLGAKNYLIKPSSVSGIRQTAELLLRFCR
jgi:CheY-like chemotaxis protein